MLFISDYDSETKYGNEYMNMHRIEGEMKVRIVYVQKKKNPRLSRRGWEKKWLHDVRSYPGSNRDCRNIPTLDSQNPE